MVKTILQILTLAPLSLALFLWLIFH